MTALVVDVKTAASMLGVSPWTVREYVATGELPVVKLPATKGAQQKSRRVLIAVADLESFVARCKQ